MVTSIVYTLVGLILCFVLYIAFKAINTGMEAKTELKELHEKKILSDEEFTAAKKKILGE